MAIKTWNAASLTGAIDSLDAIKPERLTNGDRAAVDDDGTIRWYKYNSGSQAASNSPDVIRPSLFASTGVWEELQSPAVENVEVILDTEDIHTKGLVGTIIGGDVTKTDDNELTVSATTCRSHDNLKKLYTLAPTTCTSSNGLSTAAWHKNYLYIVLLTDGTYEIRSYFQSPGLSGDTEVTASRLICIWPNNSSGNLCEGIQTGNYFTFGKATEARIGTVSATYSTVTNGLVNAIVTKTIVFGAHNTSGNSGNMLMTDNGTDISGGVVVSSIYDDASTAGSPWGGDGVSMAYNEARQFKTVGVASGDTYLLLHSYELER